jgi:hypothetical protein
MGASASRRCDVRRVPPIDRRGGVQHGDPGAQNTAGGTLAGALLRGDLCTALHAGATAAAGGLVLQSAFPDRALRLVSVALCKGNGRMYTEPLKGIAHAHGRTYAPDARVAVPCDAQARAAGRTALSGALDVACADWRPCQRQWSRPRRTPRFPPAVSCWCGICEVCAWPPQRRCTSNSRPCRLCLRRSCRAHSMLCDSILRLESGEINPLPLS